MGLRGRGQLFSRNSPAEDHERRRRRNGKNRGRWSSFRALLCADGLKSSLEGEDGAESGENADADAIPAVPPPQNKASEGQINSDEELTRQHQAAVLIQAVFKGFMARKYLGIVRSDVTDRMDGAASMISSCIDASVAVQVSDSLGNVLISEDSIEFQQCVSRAQRRSLGQPPASRMKEDWDDSTLSSNVLKMRIQSKLEATTRRERALAYAFAQQLRSCKRRSSRSEVSDEGNASRSWLERWMTARQQEASPAEDLISKKLDAAAMAARRRLDAALPVEQKESCGSNDVSVNFGGSSKQRLGRTNLSRQAKSKPRAAKNVPRRRVASDQHHCQATTRSSKVSKKGMNYKEEGCCSKLEHQEQDADQKNVTADASPPRLT